MTERVDWITQSLFRKIAHDIVGGAGVTRGALAEIERSVGATTEMQGALFGMARRGLTRLERLARRLRLAALAESGDMTAGTAKVSLRDVLGQAVAEALELDARRTVAFESIIPAVDVTIEGDEELLRAALSEVVSNALRFSRKSVRVELVDEASGPTVLVEDDGPGFQAEFSTQLDPPLRPRAGQKGSGLALANILAIVAKHGGSFGIEPPTRSPTGARVRLGFKRPD